MPIRIIGHKAKPRQPLAGAPYGFVTDESSRIQGHAAIVLTLPPLFLMTVIFMIRSYKRAVSLKLAGLDGGIVEDPGACRHRLDLAAALLDDRNFQASLLSG